MLNHVSMAINTKCNNSCIWCYAKATQKQSLDMSDETFGKVLSLIKQTSCKYLTFLGGEPTLHPKLVDFIHKAAINNLDSVIVSNGSGYSNSFFTSIEDVKDKITLNISIEGATANIHDNITKKRGSFNMALNGIKLAKDKNFNIAATITLCKSNMQDLGNVIHILKDMGINSMLINFANRPLNAVYEESIYLSIKEFSKQIAISVKNVEHSLDISVGPPLPWCQLSPLFKELLNENKIHLDDGCQLLFGQGVTIDFEGNFDSLGLFPNI